MSRDDLTARLDAEIDAHHDELVALSRRIHARPEPAFAEHDAAAAVADALERGGYVVTRGAYGLPTAVEGVAGHGSLRVVLCAEYDALPEIGHGCGHNLIATASVGAGLALAALADELDLTVVVLGTPAEEHGGGKTVLLERGAWLGAHLSLMMHPVVADDDVRCENVVMQAVARYAVDFTGRASHAAAAPELGVNAGDAAALSQVAIGLLRQQLPDAVRVNAIVVDGGTVTNIIPERSRLLTEVRSPRIGELEDVAARVRACFEGAALATGCRVQLELTEPVYEEVTQDAVLAAAWDRSVERVRGEAPVARTHAGGSTDMGNVSAVVPSIHPYLSIRGNTAVPHSAAFAAVAGSAAGERTALEGAKALADTVRRIAGDAGARRDLEERRRRREAGAG
jgi:amidohydrolase